MPENQERAPSLNRALDTLPLSYRRLEGAKAINKVHLTNILHTDRTQGHSNPSSVLFKLGSCWSHDPSLMALAPTSLL